jgi:DNA polymerase-1
MLVRKQDFKQVINELKKETFLSLDTETTGLYPYQGDRLFSIIIGTEHDAYYFNFNDYPGLDDDDCKLSRELIGPEFTHLLDDGKKTVFMANAKFDMHMLSVEGVEIKSTVWDVLTIAKTLNNTHMQYSLKTVAERVGYEKSNAVDDYIKEHKLKDEKKNPRYDWVPLEIIRPYGEQDARITFDIGIYQMVQVLGVEAANKNKPSFKKLVERECQFTKVLFEIEKVGMKIDAGFIERAIRFEGERAVQATNSFRETTGQDFVDSAKSIFQAVGPFGISPGLTKKGNVSFTDDVLANIQHPLAETIRTYRDASKRVNTYYKGFLSYADKDGTVHPNIKQTGADTFRLSITDPALQTLNKPNEDSGKRDGFEVRDSFISREGLSLVAIDYKQQEYRLTADYAGEMDLIKAIQGGTDVHTATASLMGVTRTQAKTLNFMLLYGGGVAKLCLALMKPKGSEMQLKALTKKYIYKSAFKTGEHDELIKALPTVTDLMIDHDLPLLQDAYELQQKYFSSLTQTKDFIDRVQNQIKANGYIYNWAGRRLYFPNPRFAYKGPNYLIQSSGSEIMRAALIELHEFLKPFRTSILLSIHDEILFEMPDDELYLIPEIQRIMEGVYKPFNGCYMGTDVKIGKSWGSMKTYEKADAV